MHESSQVSDMRGESRPYSGRKYHENGNTIVDDFVPNPECWFDQIDLIIPQLMKQIEETSATTWKQKIETIVIELMKPIAWIKRNEDTADAANYFDKAVSVLRLLDEDLVRKLPFDTHKTFYKFYVTQILLPSFRHCFRNFDSKRKNPRFLQEKDLTTNSEVYEYAGLTLQPDLMEGLYPLRHTFDRAKILSRLRDKRVVSSYLEASLTLIKNQTNHNPKHLKTTFAFVWTGVVTDVLRDWVNERNEPFAKLDTTQTPAISEIDVNTQIFIEAMCDIWRKRDIIWK